MRSEDEHFNAELIPGASIFKTKKRNRTLETFQTRRMVNVTANGLHIDA
jgi:hypothetical protein